MRERRDDGSSVCRGSEGHHNGRSAPSAPPQRWRGWWRIHFWFSVVYSVTNLPHLIADILVPDARVDQIVLMAALVVFGLLINLEGWRWWRNEPAPNG